MSFRVALVSVCDDAHTRLASCQYRSTLGRVDYHYHIYTYGFRIELIFFVVHTFVVLSMVRVFFYGSKD